MKKRSNNKGSIYGLQMATLCISIAMVLILLGFVIMSVMTGRNLEQYFKENLVVTMLLEQDMTEGEAKQLCDHLKTHDYIKSLNYISKEQSLKEQTQALGTDPTEFTGGYNPFLSTIELTLRSDYANNDSLLIVSKKLKSYPKVSEINYQKDLVEGVNKVLQIVSIILLCLAALFTFISFALINSTVRLSIYSKRFSIHTMKLVGASWGFIRRPFIFRSMLVGFLSSLLAILVLGGIIYVFTIYEPGILSCLTWEVMAVSGVCVLGFGLLIPAMCAAISVNKFLRMKADKLYKI